MANSSDPYQPIEEKLKLTRQSLQILQNYDLKINLVTKSSAILNDLSILKKVKRILVTISLTTLNERLAKKLEPKASSPQKRLEAVKILSKHLPVAVRLDPLIYSLNTAEIEELVEEVAISGAKQIITSTYKAKPDNYKKMTAAFTEHKKIWDDLYLKKGEVKGRYIYLPKNLRKQLIGKVRKKTLEKNLRFSSCREGFVSLNTANCDGSFWLG